MSVSIFVPVHRRWRDSCHAGASNRHRRNSLPQRIHPSRGGWSWFHDLVRLIFPLGQVRSQSPTQKSSCFCSGSEQAAFDAGLDGFAGSCPIPFTINNIELPIIIGKVRGMVPPVKWYTGEE